MVHNNDNTTNNMIITTNDNDSANIGGNGATCHQVGVNSLLHSG